MLGAVVFFHRGRLSSITHKHCSMNDLWPQAASSIEPRHWLPFHHGPAPVFPDPCSSPVPSLSVVALLTLTYCLKYSYIWHLVILKEKFCHREFTAYFFSTTPPPLSLPPCPTPSPFLCPFALYLFWVQIRAVESSGILREKTNTGPLPSCYLMFSRISVSTEHIS